MNGDSILKLSCASEYAHQGVASVADKFSQILVSTIPEAVEDLLRPMDEMVQFHVHTQTSTQYGPWAAILRHMNVHSWMVLPLFQDKRIIGLMFITWAGAPNQQHLKDSRIRSCRPWDPWSLQ